MRSLSQFLPVQSVLARARKQVLTRFWGMTIAPTAQISLKANLDRTHPSGVVVGEYSWVAFDAVILTHDRTRGLYRTTVVGENCFIGARSVLLPGVVVGNNSVVAAGAVVTRDVPPRSVVAGNPARVIREGITVGHYGRFLDDRSAHQG